MPEAERRPVLRVRGSDGVVRRALVLLPGGAARGIAVVFHPFGFEPEAVVDGEEPGERLIRSLPPVSAAATAFGLAVLAPEGRGRDTPTGHSLAWAAHLDSVWEAVETLAKQIGGEPPVVAAGLSMGGLEALVFAARFSPVRAVSASNPIVDLGRWHDDLSSHDDALLRAAAAVVRSEVGGPPSAVPADYAPRSALTYVERLATIPVQLVWSDVDTIAPHQAEAHAGRLASLLRSRGGYVDERRLTVVAPSAELDPGRFAHESFDPWAAFAFLAAACPDGVAGGRAPVL